MALSCSCDDFDKGDHDRWWEPGRPSVPPVGERCCECDAPLPQEPCDVIVHMEVFEPEDEPRAPWDVDANEDVDIDEIEKTFDAYRDRNGWDDDCERYERVRSRDYRCERCAGLATSIEDLGYCMIPPGDLAEAHCDYVEQSGLPEIIWTRRADGVFHPRRMTRMDFLKRELRRRRNRARYLLLQGGWKSWLRWQVFKIESRIMRALGYQYRYTGNDTYGWQRKEARA